MTVAVHVLYIILFREKFPYNLLARDRTSSRRARHGGSRTAQHNELAPAEWKLGEDRRREQRRVGERESAALSLSENICTTRRKCAQWRRERREIVARTGSLALPTKWPAGDLAIGARTSTEPALVRAGVPSRARAAFCQSAALTPAPPRPRGVRPTAGDRDAVRVATSIVRGHGGRWRMGQRCGRLRR